MTPCEELGYEVGDEFEIISVGDYRSKHGYIKRGSSGFVLNQKVTLYFDDGSDIPLFEGFNDHQYRLADGEMGAYHPLAHVRKLKK